MTIAVIGLGLIGGSVALDLLDRGHDVVGVDVDDVATSGATDAGVRIAPSVEDAAADAELVVVAVPPRHTAAAVRAALAANQAAPVTDVASIKAAGVLDLPYDAPRFVGGHPMAGTERSGWHAARRGLVAGAPWLLTPSDTVEVAALAHVLRVVLDLGARPVILDPSTHDELVAAVSHLPHLLAFGLHATASANAPAALDLVAGPSFRDATRVAASDPTFWGQVLASNHGAVVAMAGAVRAWLEQVEATDDPDELAALLTEARRVVRPTQPDQRTITVSDGDAAVGLDQLRALGTAGYLVTDVTGSGATTEITVARG